MAFFVFILVFEFSVGLGTFVIGRVRSLPFSL